jgi:translation initiation factor 2-alpha kinase 4
MDELSIRSAQQQELESMRAIFLDDWKDLPPVRTAWGTKGEVGWWTVRLKRHDGLVGVTLKGRLPKVSAEGFCLEEGGLMDG